MFEELVPVIQAIGVLLGALAFVFSVPRIAMVTAAFLAFKNNDRDLAIVMMRLSIKAPKQDVGLKEALNLLPKGNSDAP